MLRTVDMQRPDVVVIDFGISKAMSTADGGVCGTPGYIPPETWTAGKWYPKGDIFSLGVVMMQLVTDNVPDFDAKVINPATRKGVFMNGCLTLQDFTNCAATRQPSFHLLQRFSGLEDLCRGMLEKQLAARLPAPRALEHAWFTGAPPPSPLQPTLAPLLPLQGAATTLPMQRKPGPCRSSAGSTLPVQPQIAQSSLGADAADVLKARTIARIPHSVVQQQ